MNLTIMCTVAVDIFAKHEEMLPDNDYTTTNRPSAGSDLCVD